MSLVLVGYLGKPCLKNTRAGDAVGQSEHLLSGPQALDVINRREERTARTNMRSFT